MPLKIGFVTSGLSPQMTGIEVYEWNLLNQLVRSSDIHVTAITHNPISGIGKLEQEIIYNPFRHLSASYLWLSYVTTKIAKEKYDLLHYPEQIPHIPLRRQVSIATQFDLTAFMFPQGHPWMRVWIQKLLTKKHLDAQRGIITCSSSTKNDIMRIFRYSSDKIRVIPLAISSHYSPQSIDQVNRVREKYLLPERFLLSVGTIEPRKNPISLLRVFQEINDPNLGLVYVGRAGWKMDSFVAALKKGSFGNRVRWLDYVDLMDLPAIYSASEMLVFPSFYEGFGFPVLEAMACGTPCVASSISSTPEVLGDAGFKVNPHDNKGLKEAITQLLNSPELRDDFRKRGLRRSKEFSWERTCKETILAYREAVGLD